MAFIEPYDLEEITEGLQNWHTVYNSNLQKISDLFEIVFCDLELSNDTDYEGSLTIYCGDDVFSGSINQILANPGSASTATILSIEALGSSWDSGAIVLKVKTNDGSADLIRGYNSSTEKFRLDSDGAITCCASIYFSGGGGICSLANANLKILPNGTGITVIGDAGSTSHTLNTNDDLLVTGRIEVDGISYLDNQAFVDYSAANGNANVLSIIHSLAGTPANNDATSILLRNDYSGPAEKSTASIQAIVEDVNAGAPKGSLALSVLITSGSLSEKMRILSAGYVGINVTDPDTRLEILDTAAQLKLSYDGSNYVTFAVQSDGDLNIDSNKTSFEISFDDAVISTTGGITAGASTFGDISLSAAGVISVGTENGNLTLIPNGTGYTIIGNAGSTSHTLNTNDDLFVSGRLEVDGVSYFDEAIYLADDKALILGGAPDAALDWSTGQATSNTLVFGLGGTSNSIIFTTYANIAKDFDHAAQTNPAIFVQSVTDPDTQNDEWWCITHDQTDAYYSRGSGIHKFDAVIRYASSLFWASTHVDVLSISEGGSGATWTAPDANTLGGYLLDADTEFLYTSVDICDNWDAATDLEVLVTFEVNVDNSGGNAGDTVDLQLVCYYKGNADTVNKTQTLENAVTVGQSPQYKQFTTTFTIDYDLGGNVVEVGDKMSFILNLETDTSEVDNIIVNHIYARYKTAKSSCEV